MLLKGETGSAIVDLHADDTSPTGVRFDQPNWKHHLQSLKPLGLACMLNLRDLSAEVGAVDTAPVLPAASPSMVSTAPPVCSAVGVAKVQRKRKYHRLSIVARSLSCVVFFAFS